MLSMSSNVVKSSLLKCVLHSFIPDQCVESSLQVKINSPARTVSVKEEPEDHLDFSKFQSMFIYFIGESTGSVKINRYEPIINLSIYSVATSMCGPLH